MLFRSLPMNGAVWTGSPMWTLFAKMSSDFDRETLAALSGRSARRNVISIHAPLPPAKETILAGNSTMAAAAVGSRETEHALAEGWTSTVHALHQSGRSTRRFLRRLTGVPKEQ